MKFLALISRYIRQIQPRAVIRVSGVRVYLNI